MAATLFVSPLTDEGMKEMECNIDLTGTARFPRRVDIKVRVWPRKLPMGHVEVEIMVALNCCSYARSALIPMLPCS